MLQELKSMFEKQAGVERFDLLQTFHASKQEKGKPVAAYVLKMKGYAKQLERLGYVLPQDLSVGLILNGLTNDFAEFVRNYNMHNMGKIIGELHAMLIEYEKGLPKKDETPQVMAIRSGKIQKANKNSLKTKGKGKANGKGKDKQVYIPKPKNPKPSAKEHPSKDDTCHHCNEDTGCALKEPSITWTLLLWHCCLAHISKKRIEKLQHEGLLKSTDDESFDQCVPCLSGKMMRKSFPHCPERATNLLGLIHTDNEVEKQLGKTIKALRSDRGGKYISQEFKDYLKACVIVQQLTPPYTPQYNGVSERRNRTLLDMVRSMMNLTTLPLSFWDYALDSATRILNMVPTKKVDKTPYEL
ncbi:retrotransposon protein, putative, ty1-copia subclass [Tanacetum coccineum]